MTAVDDAALSEKHFRKAAARVARHPERKPASRPISIRLTDTERARLEREAGRLSLSAYVRSQLLGDTEAHRRETGSHRKRPSPSIDHVAIGRALAKLGQSELSHNLQAIAEAAKMGALPVDDDLIDALTSACADIRAMRLALFQALGIKADTGP